MKKLKLLLASLMMALGISSVLVAAPVMAAPVDDACAGLRLAGGGATCDKASAEGQFEKLVRSVIDVLSVITGAVCVIMIIVGGFRYIISNGDQNGVQGAKNTILYSIVGLVVVLLAQVIVRFVFSMVT